MIPPLAGSVPRSESMMWNGTVRSLPLPEQIAITARAGYGQLCLPPDPLLAWKDGGRSIAELRSIAADAGVRLSHLDPVSSWSRHWSPPDGPSARGHGSVDTPLPEFLDLAEELGATAFTAIGIRAPRDGDLGELVEDFAALCDLGADRGMTCELEFIPLGGGVPDLATAWAVLQGAGRPNAGIVFDLWHFVHSGSSLDLLASIPGESISAVQLTDASATMQSGSWLEDCLQHRLPIGDGDFPIARILETLATIGGLHKVGPEYYSAALDRRTGPEIAEVVIESTAWLFRD